MTDDTILAQRERLARAALANPPGSWTTVQELAAALQATLAELRAAQADVVALRPGAALNAIRRGRIDPPADTPETLAKLAGYDAIPCPKCGSLCTLKSGDELRCEACEF